MPLVWGLAHNRTHTLGVYGNYDREKRNRNHERGVDRWNRKTGKTDRIYEENRIIPLNMNIEQGLRVEDQKLITRNYKEKYTNEQE
jgi:hypothetical protein